MVVMLKSKEVAETIAAQVEAATGTDCEAFTNTDGAVIVCNRTKVIARITPMFSVMDIEPVGGLFDGETVCIPLVAQTIDGIREIVYTTDRATSHVLSAAMDR